MDLRIYLVAFVILINFTSFNIFLYDKKLVKNFGRSRIREYVFFVLAVIGGSLGIYLGMNILNYKTRKARYRFGIPVIIILQLIAIAFLRKYI